MSILLKEKIEMIKDFEKVLPKYYLIKEKIKDLIYSGKLKSEEKLPSEYVLAKKWKVSRLTVNKAFNLLVQEGFLYRERGNGTFVTNLQRKQTKNIAVLVYHIKSPFCAHLVQGIEEKARKYNYHIILCNTFGSKEKTSETINQLIREEKVDGIICPSDNFSSKLSLITQKRKVPVVLFPQAEKIYKNCSYVVADDEKGTYQAVCYLINQGHKKIGFLTPENWAKVSLLHRWNGYKKAMQKYRLKENKIIINPVGLDFEKNWLDFDTIIDKIKKFTAIFCVNDSLAIALLKYLREKKIKVPEDISIVGFDNIEMSGYPDISLTTVEQPIYEIGAKSVEILIKHITGKIKSPQFVVLPTRLILRKTTKKIN